MCFSLAASTPNKFAAPAAAGAVGEGGPTHPDDTLASTHTKIDANRVD